MRRLPWLALLLLLWGCLTVSVRPAVSEPSHEPGTPVAHVDTPGLSVGTVHLASTLATDPQVFYSNMRANGMFYVNDPFFGAKGNDSTDDTAAIIAADAAAKSVLGTVYFPPPSVAYKVTSEIPVQWAAHWRGGSQNLNQTIIRAHASMRSIVNWQSAFCPSCSGQGAQPELGGAPRALVEGLTFDANFQADNAVIVIGAEYSVFDNDRFINAATGCFRNAQTQLAVTLGSVTRNVGSTSPPGVTVAQADQNYFYPPLVGTTGTYVVKVQTTGTLGAATYVLSQDNGVTFTTGALPISGTTFLAFADAISGISRLAGATATFPAGTYHAGDTYSFAVTWHNGIYSVVAGASGDLEIGHSAFHQCGTIFSSSGFAADYSGYHGSISAPGTVSTTDGSPVLLGVGTSWTSIPNAGWSISTIKVAASPTPLVYEGQVLDDTHFQVFKPLEPTTTASGLAWAIATGAGYIEAGEGEGQWCHFHDNLINLSSNGALFSAAQGPMAEKINVVGAGIAGGVFGGGANPLNRVSGAHAINWHCNSGTNVDGAVCFFLGPGSTGELVEPQSGFTIAGDGSGGWFLRQNGVDTPLSASGAVSYVPLSNLQLTASQQSITSCAQQIIAPRRTALDPTGATAYVQFSLSTDCTMSHTPVISPGSSGQLLYLENDSVGTQTMTLEPTQFFSSGIQTEGRYLTIAPGETARFISRGASAFPNWEFLGMTPAYGLGGGVGNTGCATRRIQTVSSTTPTAIYQLAVQAASAIAPNGTSVKFDVSASNGTQTAQWKHWEAGWTNTGTRTAWIAGTESGSGAGGLPPLGWALSADGNVVGPANIFVAGDSSSTPVTWTIEVCHQDHGQ